MLERALWAVGVAASLLAATGTLDGVLFQRVEQARFVLSQPEGSSSTEPRAGDALRPHLSAWETLAVDISQWSPGRVRAFREAGAAERALALLEIPAIGLRVLVVAGTDALALNRGVGHVEGTSWPGSLGNVALAGHRDGFFRRIGELAPGDRLVLRTLATTHEYTVESSAVVRPDAVHVLAEDGSAVLTLVTCYPFRYVGSAPERYVVRASLVGSATGTSTASATP